MYEDARRIEKAGHPVIAAVKPEAAAPVLWKTEQYDRVEEALRPVGCAVMYRHAMLDQIGGFDEDFSLMRMMRNLACACRRPCCGPCSRPGSLRGASRV